MSGISETETSVLFMCVRVVGGFPTLFLWEGPVLTGDEENIHE